MVALLLLNLFSTTLFAFTRHEKINTVVGTISHANPIPSTTKKMMVRVCMVDFGMSGL